jgi:hypothetical protein
MFIFGFCTNRNIHHIRQVLPNNINQQSISRHRRSESSLTKMLLTQVLIFTLLSLPFAVVTFYQTFTFYQEKPPVQGAIEGFLFNVFLLVAFVPNCISIIIYTLTGRIFRQAFIDLSKTIIQYLRCCH